MRKSPRRQPNNSLLIMLVLLVSLVFIILQTRWAEKNKDQFINPRLTRELQPAKTAETVRLICSHCDASGRISIRKDGVALELPCPVCHGLSFVRLVVDKTNELICPQCHGLQSLPSGVPYESHPCPRCNATGVIEKPNPYADIPGPVETWLAECHYCPGTGLINEPNTGASITCPVCLGKSHREVRRFYPEDDLCPACGGMGRERQEDGTISRCSRCEGRGAI